MLLFGSTTKKPPSLPAPVSRQVLVPSLAMMPWSWVPEPTQVAAGLRDAYRIELRRRELIAAQRPARARVGRAVDPAVGRHPAGVRVDRIEHHLMMVGVRSADAR